MDIDIIGAINSATRGCACRAARLESGWSFAFDGEGDKGCAIFVSAPWRIVSGREIAHAVDDDGQWFGLPEPVDGETKANKLLDGKRVRSFVVDPVTADLRVEFDDGFRLDVFTNSAGYESWNASFELAEDEVTLVGGGGGNLSFVSVPKGSNPRVVFAQPMPTT
jgi:hypothetical protein